VRHAYLQRLCRLRREQREREAAKKEEKLGGLVTEEGHARILGVGKRESLVLYDESQELVARHVGGGGSSKLLLQDKACVVLPEDYNLQDPTYAGGFDQVLIPNSSDAGQIDVELSA
jgi:hypothetical protein